MPTLYRKCRRSWNRLSMHATQQCSERSPQIVTLIAAVRKECIWAKMVEERGRTNPIYEGVKHKQKKGQLRLAKAIKASYKQCGEELLEKVNIDPYKDYTMLSWRDLGGRWCNQQKLSSYLFVDPADQERYNPRWWQWYWGWRSLKWDICSLWAGRYPQHCTHGGYLGITFLWMYNKHLRRKSFQLSWNSRDWFYAPSKKTTEQIFIIPPLCTLDTTGKILKRMIYGRIVLIS